MSNAFFNVPKAVNEPVKSYAKGSAERAALLKEYERMYHQDPIDVPMYIGSKEIRTDDKKRMAPPHEHAKTIGHFNYGDSSHVHAAIDAALDARKAWANLPWHDRAAVFLRAADLLAGPFRERINASTMLAQSKNVFQAEIDAACELIDFFRFNVQYMTQIYQEQPESLPGMWNRLEYRPLEGFVFAVTPFNFTSIAANLCAAPAMMGNVVVWKPAETQVYSAQVIMELFKEAGLPDGVINMITVDGPTAGDIIFSHKEFAGLHFTGSTAVFRSLWKTIGSNLEKYRSYPRIVGETGGKDFVVAHGSANPLEVATALARGAFEFQGQKCSAASRAYVPRSIWNAIKDDFLAEVEGIKQGHASDFSNFMTAVIDEKAFKRVTGAIDRAHADKSIDVAAGGTYDGSEGWFIRPTVLVGTDPTTEFFTEEYFGPVLAISVYEDNNWRDALAQMEGIAKYALTGAVIAQDRDAINEMSHALRFAAGNFYINDKPTGAVVGQQPFGGARASGTNDKAGAALNLQRWTSDRSIKETMVPAQHYSYPFMG
jgi:1-pyrroline-5-carboxylate dehydrogenase